MKNRIILTDIDGAVLDYEYAFDIWMLQHGFNKQNGAEFKYDMGTRYGIDKEQSKKLIRIFNESASIGFLPALRDSMFYVKRLHEEHGFVFHCITSLSKNENAQKLRTMNLQKLFGKTAFEKFIYLDTGEDKDQALENYKNTGCWWIEDKIDNCKAGLDFGLSPLLMEHGHNMDFEHPEIPRVKNWREIYDKILLNK